MSATGEALAAADALTGRFGPMFAQPGFSWLRPLLAAAWSMGHDAERAVVDDLVRQTLAAVAGRR